MYDLRMTFTHPWLLLLILPALAAVLIPYFLLAKKYRRNRNRVVAVILHCLVAACCVLLVAGTGFSYQIDNSSNELLLLVDASFSTQEEKDARDAYVSDVIAMTDVHSFRLGIITFGCDQVYALPLTNELSGAYERYLEAPLPDTSATDIAAALDYAGGVITSPESAKIVLISDGVETDERAMSRIRTLAAAGTCVDTVACNSYASDADILLVGAELPARNVAVGEEFILSLSLTCTAEESMRASITLSDNGTESAVQEVTLTQGTQTVRIPHTVSEDGLHTLRFEAASAGDEVEQNNVLYTYFYIAVHENVLVVQSEYADPAQLGELLSEYNVTVLTAGVDALPETLSQLRAYDEIVFHNIANSDLPEGFIELVNEYVYDCGGGLLTVGGSEGTDASGQRVAHAYDRSDMANTLYQQMLPVQAIDYTPPLGLVLVVDVSGSMDYATTGSDDMSRLDMAKKSAVDIVRDTACLSERDYCGVLTLGSDPAVATGLLPMSRQYEIEAAIQSISQRNDGTSFTPALERAGMELTNLHQRGIIQKMHVIVLSDGMASDYPAYLDTVRHYHEMGVTFSFVAIASDVGTMSEAAEAGGGRAFSATASDLTQQLRDDITVGEIKDVVYGEFTPVLNPLSDYAGVIAQADMPKLYGFYGTRVRSSDYVVLSGDYGVPIYAQWRYGEGSVGSFMCDIGGEWSDEFTASEAGSTLLRAIVYGLFPSGSLAENDISVILTEENYITQMSIYTAQPLAEGESIRVEAVNTREGGAQAQVVQPTAADGYSRCTLRTQDGGVYAIRVLRIGADGQIAAENTFYKSFSYSAEYVSAEADAELLAALALAGNGKAYSLEEGDAWSAFDGFVLRLDRSFDPSIILAIAAIVLFLLDIAVRKFKFKWLHEIIRERREKRFG